MSSIISTDIKNIQYDMKYVKNTLKRKYIQMFHKRLTEMFNIMVSLIYIYIYISVSKVIDFYCENI